MAKVELKGFIIEVMPIETVGEKAIKKQSLVLKVPAYTDEFGEKKGKDEFWKIDIMGDRVAKINALKSMENQKAKCTVFINSSYIVGDAKKKTNDMYIINANLSELTLLQ